MVTFIQRRRIGGHFREKKFPGGPPKIDGENKEKIQQELRTRKGSLVIKKSNFG
jgi:hypothetical protein